VHSIQASKLGMKEKAYEMYLRTARLDLDDYNNDTEDGCHITSMAGTWLAVVKGFGGMRVEKDQLLLAPYCPDGWTSFAFKIRFRGALLQVTTTQQQVTIENFSAQAVNLSIYGDVVKVDGNMKQHVSVSVS
jgi:maltose phosphorylase